VNAHFWHQVFTQPTILIILWNFFNKDSTTLKPYIDGMQAYHVASLVHPPVLLEAEMFSSVQEALKNQQTTIFMHF
jgi:hypothetical protein